MLVNGYEVSHGAGHTFIRRDRAFRVYLYDYFGFENTSVSLLHFAKRGASYEIDSITFMGLRIYAEIYRYIGLASQNEWAKFCV